MKVIAPSLSYVTLDVNNQTINSVKVEDQNKTFCLVYKKTYVLKKKDLGEKLFITLNRNYTQGEKIELKVQFETSIYAKGLSWVKANRTASKKLDYLYTKCEPIYCRSILPLQDSPFIKTTYSADITYDSQYRALMSANLTKEEKSEELVIKKVSSFYFPL